MQVKPRMLSVAALCLLAAGQAVCGQELRLPKVFGDHMVLQQELPVVVWGWGKTGQDVLVQFAGQKQSTHVGGDGHWRVTLDPLKASAEGKTLAVKAGDESIAFNDVVVGEVWLCSGQSNMEMAVASCNNAKEEIAHADYPTIRHIMVEHVMLADPADDVQTKAGWQRCSPQTAGGFTAAGYYCARELLKELKVPIGLVHSSWGGSMIEPFTSLAGFKAVPELANYVKRIEDSTPGHPNYEKAVRNTMAATQKWLTDAERALAEGDRVGTVPTLPGAANPLQGWADPTNKYNAMIHGLIPYRIRGTIWYQGEANRNDGMLYVKKTEALLAGWRQAWGQPELPHYYVQIAPYQYGDEDPTILPTFWEAQAAIEREIPYTGMVVTHDIGNTQDIHPKNKQVVGYRLAALALANTYGKNTISGGPRFEKMAVEGDSVRVFFNRIGGGLVTSDGKAPDAFEIGGENGIFVAAEATIDGETIVLRSPKVRRPCAIRYAWSKLAEPNLRNAEAFPVSAFRCGRLPERAMVDRLVPQATDYELLYSHDIGSGGTSQNAAAYRVDRTKDIRTFDRVAYFLVLQKDGGSTQYVWASMKPFTTDACKLGIPTVSTQACFHQSVEGLEVRTNVDGVRTGEGMTGYIEFWPSNYGPENTGEVDGASDEAFDFGDTPGTTIAGYGSMQIHNPSAKQTVMALNRWWDAAVDVGIGNSPEGNPDYTFRGNAGRYHVKRLMVLVRPTK